uniref:RING-type domain-containing protein n=1 Tax=Salarias fasciatus TaxID=181472 RepID=A0A672GAM7_SALFA
PEERKPEDEDLDPSCACLCCWDVLVDPVTLLCQHTFCLHCLALWFDVSERDVCPQCLEEWFIYPEIDVELRYGSHGRIKAYCGQKKKKKKKTLWEFKVPIDQKSLFLMLAMKFSPRLTMLYLYVFDYYDAFLPFLHACCPNTDASSPVKHTHPVLLCVLQMDTTWLQWAEFLFKYCVLPFQLAGEYTWNLVSDQSWTFFFIFLNAMLLSVLEFCILFRLFFFSSIRYAQLCYTNTLITCRSKNSSDQCTDLYLPFSAGICARSFPWPLIAADTAKPNQSDVSAEDVCSHPPMKMMVFWLPLSSL